MPSNRKNKSRAMRHGLVANELRGPMESGVMSDASTEGDSATGGASTRAPCKYTRANVRGMWFELRDRKRVDAPLSLELPSLTIPQTALATMKRGPPKYADFAKSVPPRNPFMPTSAHGDISQINIGQYNNGCSGSQICGDFAQPSSVHHYYHCSAIAPPAAAPPVATAPAAAPPAASAPAASAPVAMASAAAPPSSDALQLADIKAMFDEGLIPSLEIYEDKARQILGLR